jgi:hypothetical protein
MPSPKEGDGGFVIEFGGVCYQDTYPMYLTCIVHVSCMYLDVSRQDTSRYIEIQQDTFVSVTLAIIGNVSYLRISVSFFTIHLGYSKDTFRIQCILTLRYMTHKIHARYMSDTKGYIRGYVSRALLAGALGYPLRYPQTPEIRVPHVSRMYPACIPHVSIHIRYISLWMHLRYMYLIMYLGCIPHVS